MAKSKFLKVLNFRNRQSKYSKLQVMKKATAIILALSLGLGTTAPTFTYAKEATTVVQVEDKDSQVNSKPNYLDKEFVKNIDESQLPTNLEQHYTFLYTDNDDLEGKNKLGEYLTQEVFNLFNKLNIKDIDFTIETPSTDKDYYSVYVFVKAGMWSDYKTKLFTINFIKVENEQEKISYEKLIGLDLPSEI